MVVSPCSNYRNAALDCVGPPDELLRRGSLDVVSSSRLSYRPLVGEVATTCDWSFVITDVLGTILRGNSNDIYELLDPSNRRR